MDVTSNIRPLRLGGDLAARPDREPQHWCLVCLRPHRGACAIHFSEPIEHPDLPVRVLEPGVTGRDIALNGVTHANRLARRRLDLRIDALIKRLSEPAPIGPMPGERFVHRTRPRDPDEETRYVVIQALPGRIRVRRLDGARRWIQRDKFAVMLRPDRSRPIRWRKDTPR